MSIPAQWHIVIELNREDDDSSESSQANARDGQHMHTYVIVEQPAKFEFYRRRAIELNPK